MSDWYMSRREEGLSVEKVKPEIKKPRMFKVVIVNDDYTPMDFVVVVLKRFFNMSEESAVRVMLQVHTQGKGVCGVFTRDVAETKVFLVNAFSRTNEHPLMCVLEVA